MKKTKLLGLALIATMVNFSACTNEAEDVFSQESEIKLTSEIESTSRTTTENLQSTSIVANRKIGITIKGAKNIHNNVAWTVNADGSLTNTDDPVYWGAGNATFYAYHPYNGDWEGTNHTFTVQTNQSSDEGYLNSDLLHGWKSDVAHTNELITIPFVHNLSKINITLTSNDNLNGAKIYICNTYNSLTINPQHNYVIANITPNTDGNKDDIYAGEVTGENYTVSAIIVPQLLKSGTKFIKIEFNSKDYYYILPVDMYFEISEQYNYTLNLQNKETLLESVLK